MDQQKIGGFLKALRGQKGVTQEQLAEIFHVSNRSVSRWENGKNLPDLDVLLEIADYYRVDLRELLNGEREKEQMDRETEETVLQAVDYTNTKTQQHNRRMHFLLIVGAILLALSQIISHTTLAEHAVLGAVSDFADGAACGLILVGVVATSRFGARLKAFKQRLLSQS